MTRPICTACKHYQPDSLGSEYGLCNAPQKLSESARLAGFTNGTVVSPRYCDLQRDAGFLNARLMNKCGLEGRWFEPKEVV